MNAAEQKSPEPAAEAEPLPKAPAWQRSARLSDDELGLGWLYGSLCAAVFRRNKMVESWTAETPVKMSGTASGNSRARMRSTPT